MNQHDLRRRDSRTFLLGVIELIIVERGAGNRPDWFARSNFVIPVPRR